MKKCKYYNEEHEDCTLDYSEIRNKAIDDFLNELKKLVENELSFHDLSVECKKCGIWKIKDVDEIAEQLKRK